MNASPARRPWRGLLLLGLAALVLDLWGIQHGPLRDWDESLVARVALELSDKPWPDGLLPSLWGQPYHNKPPGAHWLIAGLIQLWRSGGAPAGALPPEWLIRLAPALGSSLLSPLLALAQWQLRPGRRADALWTGAIALTLLPLARHAHLAMLDGLQLTAMAALWLGLLLARPSGRQPLAAGVLAGLAGTLLLLLKAPVLLPVLLVSLLLRRTDGDLQGRHWRWLLLGLGLGLLPGLAWHGWHLLCRGDAALVMWGRQGLARVANSLENHGGGPLPPLIQVLSGGWPWLALWPAGISQAWRQRRERWGRWSLGLTAMATLMVLPLQTQLPWYSLLLWPPFALCCGPVLAALVEGRLPAKWRRAIAGLWLGLGVLVLIGAMLSPLLPSLAALRPMAGLALPGGLGLLIAGWRLSSERGSLSGRGAAAWALVLGWGLSLLLLFSTPLWNWELKERPSILPLLPLVSRDSRAGQLAEVPLLVDGSIGKRPSLRWYAQDSLGRKRSRALSGTVLLVSRAKTPEQSELARRLGREQVNGSNCQLDRQGGQGWSRWLCQLGD